MTRVQRSHEVGGRRSTAEYSPCLRYRYALTRTWAEDRPRLAYVMLNPSKATEQHNDPTVERCERRATQLGYGAFRVCNLFAWCETSPKLLKTAADPVGPDNDLALAEAAEWADLILCAWGVHGSHLGRDQVVITALCASGRPLAHLGLTKAMQPRHPLYVGYDTRPMPFGQ